jgi:hypothetical protein
MARTSFTKCMVSIVLVALACFMSWGIPAQAQSISIHINLSNWYQGHHVWAQHCYSRPQNGHWGRDRHYESWCSANRRFHDTHPDSQWRRDHPWDRGAERDHR